MKRQLFALFCAIPAITIAQSDSKLTSPVDSEQSLSTPKEKASPENDNNSVVVNSPGDTIITMRTHRTVRKITYVGPRYKRTPVRYNYVSDFALGMDYSSEMYADLSKVNQNAIYGEYLTRSGGFNIYGMGSTKWSRNNPTMGSYVWGLGVNVNQFHEGDRSYVELSTDRGDSAFTQLSTISAQLYWLNRYEFQIARRLYPFIGINAGLLINSASQTTKPFVALQGYEPETQENVHGHVSTYFSPELGVRLRLSSWVSLSVSHEWRFGGNTEVANLDNSSFNNIQFDLKTDQTQMQSSMWKVGFLFDLSGGKYDREKIAEGYYDTSMEVQRVEPINRYRNRPCPPCPCATPTREANPSPGGSGLQMNGGSSPSRGSSGGGSRSLPGISPSSSGRIKS